MDEIFSKKVKVFKETHKIIRKAPNGCMIKLYPIQDTFDLNKNNRLTGLIHSYFCEAKVYDLKENIFYTSKIFHDEVRTESVKNASVSYFKDLGILHIFYEPVKIDYSQSMVVRPIG